MTISTIFQYDFNLFYIRIEIKTGIAVNFTHKKFRGVQHKHWKRENSQNERMRVNLREKEERIRENYVATLLDDIRINVVI